MFNKDLFIKYQEFTSQIKELESQKKIIADEILSEMKKINADKVQSDFGSFSVATRKTYEFIASAKMKIDSAKNKVKDLEAEAIREGLAKEKVTESIRFTPKRSKSGSGDEAIDNLI